MSATDELIDLLQKVEGFISSINVYKTNVSKSANKPASPSIGKDDYIRLISEARELLDGQSEYLDEHWPDELKELSEKLRHLLATTLPQCESPNLVTAASASVFITLFSALRSIRSWLPASDPIQEVSSSYRGAMRRLNNLEDKANLVDEQLSQVKGMLERIENVHASAERLPEELDNLDEAHRKVEQALLDSNIHVGKLALLVENSNNDKKVIDGLLKDAGATLKRAEMAYAASTSVGLAAAFDERAGSLRLSSYWWVVGLVVALLIGGVFGAMQLKETVILLNSDATTGLIALNMLTSILSFGAPVWFAWISTRQIGQSFRLSEDYAFKAAVSRAFEGYRSQAAAIDKDLEAQLLASAITRLDELPLRVIDPISHNSPLGEILNSNVVRQAARLVPDFRDSVKDLAVAALASREPKSKRPKPEERQTSELS